MENKVDKRNQNFHLVDQNLSVQPTNLIDKSKVNFLLMLIVGLISSLVFGISGYFLGKYSVKKTQVIDEIQIQQTPTPTSNINLNPIPSIKASNLKVYSSSNWDYVPNSFSQKFPDFKNNIPSKLTFTYPNTWEVFKINSAPYNNTMLMFNLHKNDPSFSNRQSDGPIENFVDMEFRIGIIDSTIQDFDRNFWGRGYIIAKTNKITLNGVEVVQAFYSDASLFPMGSLYKIAPNAQVNITTEFFNYHDQNNQTDYSKQTIQEINHILSSLKFEF